MSRSRSLALVVAGAAAVASGWFGVSQAVGSTASNSTPQHRVVSARTGPTINIRSYTFHSPTSVRPRAYVHVVNHDGEAHSVTRNGGGFSVIVPAHSSRTFRAPRHVGNYGFHCIYHSTMRGTLRVRR